MPPKIAVIGDPNTGKSGYIRRLFKDDWVEYCPTTGAEQTTFLDVDLWEMPGEVTDRSAGWLENTKGVLFFIKFGDYDSADALLEKWLEMVGNKVGYHLPIYIVNNHFGEQLPVSSDYNDFVYDIITTFHLYFPFVGYEELSVKRSSKCALQNPIAWLKEKL